MIKAVHRTTRQLEERMKEIKEIKDVKDRHSAADDALCETLKALGYGKAIDIFESFEKWYS